MLLHLHVWSGGQVNSCDCFLVGALFILTMQMWTSPGTFLRRFPMAGDHQPACSCLETVSVLASHSLQYLHKNRHSTVR